MRKERERERGPGRPKRVGCRRRRFIPRSVSRCCCRHHFMETSSLPSTLFRLLLRHLLFRSFSSFFSSFIFFRLFLRVDGRPAVALFFTGSFSLRSRRCRPPHGSITLLSGREEHAVLMSISIWNSTGGWSDQLRVGKNSARLVENTIKKKKERKETARKSGRKRTARHN